MSRTDAHTPFWASAEWYEPSHSIYCEYYIPRQWRKFGQRPPCNLPDDPHVQNSRWVYARRSHTCTWEPVFPRKYTDVLRLYGRVVPHLYATHVWHAPERVRERDQLRGMVKEYNANGELADGDFGNWQHRHGAAWSWP